uniref:ATP synthase complex subunit 8 n=1 Tax=Chaetocnema scheffleri TaxID=1425543 RepID=A0A1P8NMW4_9CUCU|nr:ATP synthase F0 subunit 8 [Chaetocnema scheffleri]
MPQMMPLNWILLLILTMIIFILFNNLNYFNFFYNINKNQLKKNKMNFNWKW